MNIFCLSQLELLRPIIFLSFLGSSQNSHENSSWALLVTCFWELEKVPDLDSNFGNKKNDVISKYKKIWEEKKKERKKERETERKKEPKQETDRQTDDRRQTADNKLQTDRKTKPFKSSRFTEISRANFLSRNLGYKLNTSCSRYWKRELENYEA